MSATLCNELARGQELVNQFFNPRHLRQVEARSLRPQVILGDAPKLWNRHQHRQGKDRNGQRHGVNHAAEMQVSPKIRPRGAMSLGLAVDELHERGTKPAHYQQLEQTLAYGHAQFVDLRPGAQQSTADSNVHRNCSGEVDASRTVAPAVCTKK